MTRLNEERKQALEEAKCRLVAVEQLQADQLTVQEVPATDAAWYSIRLIERAEMFLRLASELDEKKCA